MGFPRVDAHQHVWDPSTVSYTWLGPELGPINRTIGFEELEPELARAGVDFTVLVQSADNAEDTELMIATAARHTEIAAVVAWAPLENPREAAHIIAAYAADPLVVGVRTLIHTQPDPDWLLRPDVDISLGMLESAGLTFDVPAELPRHLEILPMIAERHPALRIVIDHLAKPPIGIDNSQPWWSLIEKAAAYPSVYAKVSGLYAASGDLADWTPELVQPFLSHALDIFGPTRLMYGGDWPISQLAGGYWRVWDGITALLADLPEQERESILGRTAVEFYSIAVRI